MKGVIVQVGHPKSIVLFNNGKIGAIPTPDNCQVGMVVTVKFNSLLKIMIISLAAALLVALGIVIGAHFWDGSPEPQPPSHELLPDGQRPMYGPGHGPGHGQGHRRRMMEQHQ
ncbi:MAG: hypothetical protein FWG89_09075 [Treponema sp.]|nr:hypothetical protein [Treponema sp.]